MSGMIFDFERKIGSLPALDRLLFYELFAHNLTVMVRGIWSDETLTDTEKVDRMKSVNEILHRITAKIRHLRLSEGHWPEADIAAMIDGWIAVNPTSGGGIEAAINQSFDAVGRADS